MRRREIEMVYTHTHTPLDVAPFAPILPAQSRIQNRIVHTHSEHLAATKYLHNHRQIYAQYMRDLVIKSYRLTHMRYTHTNVGTHTMPTLYFLHRNSLTFFDGAIHLYSRWCAIFLEVQMHIK